MKKNIYRLFVLIGFVFAAFAVQAKGGSLSNSASIYPSSSPETVITPMGQMPGEFVRQLDAGSKVWEDGLTTTDASGRKHQFLPASGNSSHGVFPQPNDGHNFEEDGYEYNPAGFTYLGGSWLVPPRPAQNEGQNIFLWNGLEPAGGTCVIQPVLGIGPWSNGSSSNGWTIASWLCCNGSTGCYHSAPVDVNVGDTITGQIILNSGDSTWAIVSTDSTSGQSTVLYVAAGTAGGTQQFAYGGIMETYGVSTCSGYPATNLMSFYNSYVMIDGGPVQAGSFTPQVNVNDGCSEAATASPAQVNLYLNTPAPTCSIWVEKPTLKSGAAQEATFTCSGTYSSGHAILSTNGNDILPNCGDGFGWNPTIVGVAKINGTVTGPGGTTTCSASYDVTK
jgi:hypothetical protein